MYYCWEEWRYFCVSLNFLVGLVCGWSSAALRSIWRRHRWSAQWQECASVPHGPPIRIMYIGSNLRTLSLPPYFYLGPLEREIHSFIHSFVLIILTFKYCLRRATMFYRYCCFLLFSHRNYLFRLASSILSMFTFSSYNSSHYLLLINSIMCFIIYDWFSNYSIFNLFFSMSFIIFLLRSLYFRHFNRLCFIVSFLMYYSQYEKFQMSKQWR